ncbi:glycoside hydrolase family 3 protein [Collybiopsis luxurians FD-317 M1]|uniref:beta-glucosidase n=1 Tax=Collybiopsis luxurians FD-317 M1 TaxID=944289 RepID=A0A0D0C6Q4_9AGAR|nr:glycoside hydrolase family 3 protein [Collybiopsis luxurians FD-317 M1]
MSLSFLDADISNLVSKLRTEEKIALLGAPNWWNTTPISRLEIPSIRMSDGPNGVRGSSHFVSSPAQCLPCATSLASTFDVQLVYQVGQFLAEEAKLKSSVVLLAPTCNIQRSPLGGRAFESFSEDPYLSGMMAAAYVNGLQSQGVSAAIKHFVGNDQEHERTAAESIMSDRAFREVYLYPFMLAQQLAHPWAFMTSYGRINGVHCSENVDLLQGILRDEWNFTGIVMSDWYGTYGVDQPLNAGLDLEMPGPPRWRTPTLMNHVLTAQKLLPSTLDERAKNMLSFIQHQAHLNPGVVYGDGKERTRDTPEMRRFSRDIAAQGIVLLQNRDSVLPLRPNRVGKLAVIGPNAKGNVISGGGSAALKASYVITPYTGIQDGAFKDLEISYAVGCYAHKYLPTLENYLLTPTGERGWLATFYAHTADGKLTPPIAEFVLQDTRVKLNDFLPTGLTETWTLKMTGKLIVDKTASYELGLTVAGRAKLWINNELTIDNWTKQTPGDFFYGQGTIEEKSTVDLKAGKPVDMLIEYTNTYPPANKDDEGSSTPESQPALMRGLRLGGCEKIDAEVAMKEAVKLAKESDVVVFIGGLTPEWESEGFDRPSLDLPGRQAEVIHNLAEVNRNTVVCIQAGSATAMPWKDEVAGILQAWYLGNEVGNAIADILYGKVNPCASLPMTFPKRMEDIAAYPNIRSEFGKIHYREGIMVGYKHFLKAGVAPLFCFGHGLSYTEFELSDCEVNQTGTDVEISLQVYNVGSIAGSKVVQLYVAYPETGITHPPLQLKAFSKVHDVAAGKSATAKMRLDKWAFSYWNERTSKWEVDQGQYVLEIGFSCECIKWKKNVEVKEGMSW